LTKATLCGLLFFALTFFSTTLVTSALYSKTAKAQTITPDENFSFGRFALLDFLNVEEIDMASNGTYTHTSDIWFLQEPQRGMYVVSNAPANTNYTITVPSSDILLSGIPGRSMVLDQLGTGPDNPRTDVNGEALFWIYGRLRTQGNMSYPDATFSGDIEITIVFDN